ncbi:MAG: hypothetical protein IID40_08760 [Planctomycetes bacterium]|nr:hypothetical protein [Planctomycetota bacterium]
MRLKKPVGVLPGHIVSRSTAGWAVFLVMASAVLAGTGPARANPFEQRIDPVAWESLPAGDSFGNGLGDVVGARPGTISGYPRDEEAGRYWAEAETDINANGLPTSIYDCCSSDSSDNVGTAALITRFLALAAAGEHPTCQPSHEAGRSRGAHHESQLMQEITKRRYQRHREPPCSTRRSITQRIG